MNTDTDRIDQRLAQLLEERDFVDDDEIIPPKELEENEAAWQDYLTGRDPGVFLEELKLKLFGKKLD